MTTLSHAIMVLVCAAGGSALSSLLSCIPGLHIYNVMALLVLGLHGLAAHGVAIPPEALIPVSTGLVVGWAVNNSIPSILLGAADESAVFTVLPGQAYLMSGRGFEAVMLTAAGGLAGLVLVVAVAAPIAPVALPAAQAVFRPHYHWIVWCVIAFMLLSEWPKGGTSGQAGWRKFFEGWRSTGAGLLTFLLSGLLGFILMYRSPVSVTVSFQNLMPAFVGLFAVPWLLLNVLSGARIPPQRIGASLGVDVWTFVRGAGAGILGGGFAAFVPGVTGGVGGMLAGHATAQTDDRAFLISQGASKCVYYVGAFLLLFVPGAAATRGGAAWMVRGLHTAGGRSDYLVAVASVALAGCVAYLLAGPLARGAIRLSERWDFRAISWGALLLAVVLVLAVTGLAGLAVTAVATGIGLIPLLYGARRMNCLGVILLPLACRMSDAGPTVVRWLGLVG